jgi:hypothetical protein
MAALTKTPRPVAQDQLPVTVVDKSYQGVTVDTRYTPLKNILRYVDGARWVVRYYSQVLARSNEVAPQDIGKSAIYQQYTCIDQLQLNTSQQIEITQDPATNNLAAQGVAITPPGVIPNKGDVFLADIGDGQEGIFQVTASTKQTHLADTLYEIEYELTETSSLASARRADLDAKTIQEFVYVTDYLAVGERPIITKAAFVQRTDLLVVCQDIINQYFTDFYSHELSTLLVPEQLNNARCYDAFAVAFMRDLVTTAEAPLVGDVDLPTVRGVPGMRQLTVWDAIRRLSSSMVRGVVQRCGLLNAAYFRHQPHYGGAYYAGLQTLVYPLDPRTDADAPLDQCVPSPTGAVLQAGDVRRGDLQGYLDDRPLEGFTYTHAEGDTLPLIVPVTSDDRYVFTQAFYTGTGPYNSQLERLVHQMLRHEPLDKATILTMARQTNRWPNLERYYYAPVMVALLKIAIRTS